MLKNTGLVLLMSFFLAVQVLASVASDERNVGFQEEKDKKTGEEYAVLEVSLKSLTSDESLDENLAAKALFDSFSELQFLKNTQDRVAFFRPLRSFMADTSSKDEMVRVEVHFEGEKKVLRALKKDSLDETLFSAELGTQDKNVLTLYHKEKGVASKLFFNGNHLSSYYQYSSPTELIQCFDLPLIQSFTVTKGKIQDIRVKPIQHSRYATLPLTLGTLEKLSRDFQKTYVKFQAELPSEELRCETLQQDIEEFFRSKGLHLIVESREACARPL